MAVNRLSKLPHTIISLLIFCLTFSYCNYKVFPLRSQDIRRAVETEGAFAFSKNQKEDVAHYLAHSTAVAEQHYRIRTTEAVVATAELLDTLGR